MGGVPVKHQTSSKTRRRRSQLKLQESHLSACKNCGSPKVSHNACVNCGVYKVDKVKESPSSNKEKSTKGDTK